MITLIIAGITASILYVLFSAARTIGREQAIVEAMRERALQQRKQAEVMAQNRTPDDAVDRLDDGSF